MNKCYTCRKDIPDGEEAWLECHHDEPIKRIAYHLQCLLQETLTATQGDGSMLDDVATENMLAIYDYFIDQSP